MKKYFPILLLSLIVSFSPNAAVANQPRFKVLAFYSTNVEPDHVLFAEGALKFFSEAANKNNFTFDSTTHWDDMNDSNLGKYQMVVWLNDEPATAEQKRAFQKYMENGGAWLGFHVAAYNDKDSNWPWFVDFLGGGVFHSNNWPPLPAKLAVDDRNHPVTMDLPGSFMAPDNEWYIWKPSPRLNKDVRVLVTLDPSNYPIGFKDVLTSGDLPVVWTNTKYRMLYMNMGHGDKIFTSPIQNKLILDGILWLGTISAPAELPVATGTKISLDAEMPVASGTEISPHAVVVNQKTRKVYSVNSSDGSVTVTDSAANSTTTAKVGSEPMAIAVNSVTNKIYVGNSGSGTISVIDGTTDAVTATVKVGALPYVIAVNPTTNKIYVSRTFSNTMTVIDGATNATGDLKPGIQAGAIAVNPVTNKLYLINYESQNVTVLDGATNDSVSVVAGVHLWAIAVNPVTNKIYVASAGSSNLAAINGASNAVTTVKTGKIPCAVAVDSVANRVYAVNYAGDSVTVIDGANNSVIATIGVGARPLAIGINSVTHTIYVVNTHSNNVTMIDGTNDSVLATVTTGKGPYAIAVDTEGNKAYVSSIENTLTVISGRQGASGGHPADKSIPQSGLVKE
ncbi:MAG TPA: ThuA domain-containing protein [Candidatus Dormibacteraeota bacterium]|nr:ThuA domain-containing protein [Candidatus Dormibacteraeota bacterium]